MTSFGFALRLYGVGLLHKLQHLQHARDFAAVATQKNSAAAFTAAMTDTCDTASDHAMLLFVKYIHIPSYGMKCMLGHYIVFETACHTELAPVIMSQLIADVPISRDFPKCKMLQFPGVPRVPWKHQKNEKKKEKSCQRERRTLESKSLPQK